MEAPLVPPSHLEDDYTLQQRVPLASYYVDDSNKGQGSHYKFSAKYIERFQRKSKLKIGSFNLSRGQRFGGFIRLYLENNDKEFPRDTCSSGF